MSRQKQTEFRWSKPRLEAATLLAEDSLADHEIAARVGISRAQLAVWKKQPEFAAKVTEIVVVLEAEIRNRGIARKMRRVAALNERWERMKQVIAERATDPDMHDVPGGATGLLVRTVKQIGQGPAATTINEYAVDTGLLKELRAHEEQAAKELGQWSERVEITIRQVAERLAAAQGLDVDELIAEAERIVAGVT